MGEISPIVVIPNSTKLLPGGKLLFPFKYFLDFKERFVTNVQLPYVQEQMTQSAFYKKCHCWIEQ